MNEAIINELNKAVSDELQASMQYMYFHFRLEDMGYKPFAALFRRVGIAEMGHVEKAAERILFLGGEVEMAPAGGVAKIHDIKEMFVKARDMEAQAVRDYNKVVEEAARAGDAVTRELFESLVRDEETHFDLFADQVRHIETYGDSYLAMQVFEDDPGS